MAHTPSALSTLPLLKGTPKLPTCALEAAYHIAVRFYSYSTAAPRSSRAGNNCIRTWVKSRSLEEELRVYFNPLRWRGHPVEVTVPVVLSRLCVAECVEIGGIITKAKRKIVQCAKWYSGVNPIRGEQKSSCSKVDGTHRGMPTSPVRDKVRSLDTIATSTTGPVDTEEPFGNTSYQELTAVGNKAFCLTDTYTLDDGWGVIVCVLKNWISIRRSAPQETSSVEGVYSETYTQDMRHPPHRMGDFVRVRGRLCVKPIECDGGLELPKDFSRAFLRATRVCVGRDVQDEINWFAEVYSQVQGSTPIGEDFLRASPYAATWGRRRMHASMKRSARVSL